MSTDMKKNDSLNDMEKYSTEKHEGGVNASARQVSDLIDPAGGNKTMRMVDIRLLIILGALYSISLIDRTNISIARVAGMQAALGLSIGDRYSTITWVFFVPYILFELPSNLVLKRLGARNWLSFIVIAWGAVMTGMAFVTDWRQLVACRVLLGVLESGFFPGCVYLISSWYIRAETQKRLSVFYLTAQFISGFSNIIGYGITQLGGQGGLAAWQWIFLIFGIITMGLAVIAVFTIVDFPHKNTFLSAEQTAYVQARIELDRGDAVPDVLDWATGVSHVTDWKAWACGFMFGCATLPAYAFSYFLPIILAGSGFSGQLALLLSAPPYCAAAFYTFFVAYLSDKYVQRGLFVAINCLVSFIGLMIMAYEANPYLRYFGSFLGLMGCQANIPAILTYQSNNIRLQSKRSVTTAIVVGCGGMGGLMAGLVFRQVDFPRYLPGLWIAAGAQLMTCAILLVSHFHFKAQNRRVDAGELVLEKQPGFKYTT